MPRSALPPVATVIERAGSVRHQLCSPASAFDDALAPEITLVEGFKPTDIRGLASFARESPRTCRNGHPPGPAQLTRHRTGLTRERRNDPECLVTRTILAG